MTTLKLEPQQAEGGGGGDVTREYVDQRDAATLDSANGYTDLVASGKQNTLTAGANITIENDVISSTDSTTTVAWGGITGTLSNQTDLNSALGDKQDVLTAGDNITIVGDIISATDTTYTAGSGLDLTGTEFSVDTSTIQEKLAAGNNISINGNTISATDTTYTAGTNITIDANNEISATDTTYTAGTNITIDANNEISATDTTYTAGTNITINAQNEISAMDTTYSDFVGTDGQSDGDNGLVPAPVVADVDKFLKSDGTWATVQSGGSNITMTNVDPGEGQPLAADNYVAVYGSSTEGGFSRYAVNQTFSSPTTLLANSTNTPDVGVSYSSGVVTIQKAGWWVFTTSVGGAMNAEPSSLSVVISVNNADVASSAGYAKSGYLTTRTVSWVGKMAVGDTVKVQVTPGASITLNNNDYKDRGTFTGALIYAS